MHLCRRWGGAVDLRTAGLRCRSLVFMYMKGAGRQPSRAAIAGARGDPAAGGAGSGREL